MSGQDLVFPLGRVKKIVKDDESIPIIHKDGLWAITKATELFLERLAVDAFEITKRHKRKTMALNDLARAVDDQSCYQFLQVLPSVAEPPPEPVMSPKAKSSKKQTKKKKKEEKKEEEKADKQRKDQPSIVSMFSNMAKNQKDVARRKKTKRIQSDSEDEEDTLDVVIGNSTTNKNNYFTESESDSEMEDKSRKVRLRKLNMNVPVTPEKAVTSIGTPLDRDVIGIDDDNDSESDKDPWVCGRDGSGEESE